MTDETKPCDLLVTGDLILTLDTGPAAPEGGAIAVAGKTIVDIGPADALRAKWAAGPGDRRLGPHR